MSGLIDRLFLAGAALAVLTACGGGGIQAPSTSAPVCSVGATVAASSAGGTLSFPAVAGASGSIVYTAVGRNAKTQLAFTTTPNQTLTLASQISAVLPTGITPSGPYGIQIFQGYGASMYSEEIGAAVSGNVISSFGTAGLILDAGQTYIPEIVQNPDISQLPPPSGP
ncbi:MAG TPA: hypothetical protein VMF11_03365 [Candidatus Baltobacteraceae bacterium]|nr:hypothetical protein [Candidatus Baltobacteraceae bacterium]